MKKTILLTLALFLLISSVFSQCIEAKRSVQVPAAVSNKEGDLLKIKIFIQPGDGNIYTTIRPTTGTMTQQSQFDAINYAFESANKSIGQCEIRISFDEMEQLTPSVEGPSAGVAMSIATKAALENKSIREDVAITGAIDSFGNVKEVGGIIDKAQATALAKKKIMITPKQRIFENILLSQLEEKYGIIIIEVQDFEKAYEIATSRPDEEFESVFELEEKSIPKDLPYRELRDVDRRFASIARSINDGLKAEIKKSSGGPLTDYNEHFQREIKLNEEIIDRGYGYTAANNAFLSTVDAAFISTPPRKLDLQEYVDRAQMCVDTIEPVGLTDKNLEWVAGASARTAWAKKKISDIKNITSEIIYQEEKYLALREIYYAISWCEAAKYLYVQSEDVGGNKIDPEVLRPVANNNLRLLETMVQRSTTKDGEAGWHKDIAQESIDKKDYPAAIFDIAYSSAMQKSTAQEIGLQDEQTLDMVDDLLKKDFDTLWGRTYHSQGVYSFYKEEDRNKTAAQAIRVLILSENMEIFMDEAQQRIENPPEEFVYKKREEELVQITNMIVGLIVLGSISALLVQIIWDMFKK